MVCVFARETSEPLTGLVKQIDEQIAKNGNLKSFVVVLTDDADATAGQLKTMAADCRLKHVPLTLVESPAGPPSYKIAKDADITVMMWKGTEVKVNKAFAKGKMTEADASALIAELPKILE